MIYLANDEAIVKIAEDGSEVREIFGQFCGRGDARYSVAHIKHAAGVAGTPHFHRDGDEIYYILSGAGHMVVDSIEIPLKRGDSIVLHPGEVHALNADRGENIEFLAISVPAYRPEDFIRVRPDGSKGPTE